MFEQPNAKRIRRSKVFDDISASKSDSDSDEVTDTTTIKEIQDSIGLAYHFDYDLIENPNGKVTKFAHLQVDEPVPEEPPPDREDEAFEFRLFSRTKSSNDGQISQGPERVSTKINIRSPTPDTPSDGRFLNPHRPQSYYFASAAPPSLTTSALSGQSILSSSQTPWPGTHLPWRVIHVASSKISANPTKLPSQRKGKLNKNRRILLRTRLRAKTEREKEKEAHLREKKTRLNREKKIKRKAKEKAMKATQKESENGDGDV